MKRVLLKVLPILAVVGLLIPISTPVAAVDALGMIEVRGLTYEDFEVKKSNRFEPATDQLVKPVDALLLTATATGILHFESRPDLSGTITLSQIFEIPTGGPLRAIDGSGFGGLYRFQGRTMGIAKVMIDMGNGAEVVLGPISFKGSYVARDSDGLVLVDHHDYNITVQAAAKNGHRINLDLQMVIDHTGAGLQIEELNGTGRIVIDIISAG
ncbi:MAG: hypothetical protein ACXABY_28005 [Candidatus Thorarchaeota archaeon]